MAYDKADDLSVEIQRLVEGHASLGVQVQQLDDELTAAIGLMPVVFSASGPGSDSGLVPDPGGVAGTTKFLREDATWSEPALADLSDVSGVTGTGDVVQQSGPTLVEPVLDTPHVADFTEAGHSHTDNTNGGVLPASAIASGTVDTARLGSGSASSSSWLRGDSTWSTIPGRLIGFQYLTSGTGATYTPTSGTTMILVELVGGGGGGGGAVNTAANAAAAGGGGAGGYARKFYSSIGASYTYTVGAGGAGGAAGNNNGSQGADTTFDNGGTVITAKKGAGGTGSAAGVVPAVVAGGAGGAVSTNGDLNGAGQSGLPGRVWNGTVAESGQGGSGPFGSGGTPCITERNGIAGAGKGAGGSGGVSYGTNAKAGGAGTDGVIVVWEFK